MRKVGRFRRNCRLAQDPRHVGFGETAPVEFVDLRPGSNTVVQGIGPAAEPVPADPAPDYQASFKPASVPGFVSGTNAVLAFDSSVVAAGSTVSFWTAGSTGQFQSLGQATVGNNPVVVTVPFPSGTAYGGSLTVVAEGAGGVSNVFQFSILGARRIWALNSG